MRNLGELVRSMLTPQLTIASRMVKTIEPGTDGHHGHTRVDAEVRTGTSATTTADWLFEAPSPPTTDAPMHRTPQRTQAWLEAAKSAMTRAGRCPSDEEVSRGAYLLARGVTKAHLERLVRQDPSIPSLAAAFETLTALIAHGVPISTAVAKIGVRLATHPSDEAIRSLDVASPSTPKGSIPAQPITARPTGPGLPRDKDRDGFDPRTPSRDHRRTPAPCAR